MTYAPPKDNHWGDILDIAFNTLIPLSIHLSMVPLWLMEKGSSTITFTFLGIVLGRLFPALLSSPSLTPFLR